MSDAIATGGSSAAPIGTQSTPTGQGASQGPAPAAQSQGAQAPGSSASAGASDAPVAAQPERRYLESKDDEAYVKVKIDGKEQELSIKELKRLNSLEQASQKRMQDAQKERQRAMQEVSRAQQERELFKRDPDAWAKLTGIDLDSMSEERLARKYELSQMSPEQRQILELKSQLEQTKKMDLQSKQSLLNDIKELTGESVPEEVAATIPKERLIQYLQEQQAKAREHQGSLENEVLTAWKETSLPADPMFGQWVAAMMLNDIKMINSGKKDGEPLQAREAASKVKAKLNSAVKSMFSQMDAPAIQEFLGPDLCKKLRDHDIQRVTDQASNGYDKSPGSQPVSREPKKQMNQMEWRKHMGIG